MITADMALDTVRLARRLLPRECPDCGQPVLIPRRHLEHVFVKLDPIVAPGGRFTLVERGDQVLAVGHNTSGRVLHLHQCGPR